MAKNFGMEPPSSSIRGTTPANTSSLMEKEAEGFQGESLAQGPTTVKERPETLPNTTKNSSKVLSTKRGKCRKRSRNESFLSDVCALIQQQQEASDERFFKMEEARLQKELKLKEKRRREEWQHEVHMRQMMGNMFMQMTSAFSNISPPCNATHPRISIFICNSLRCNSKGLTVIEMTEILKARILQMNYTILACNVYEIV